MLIAHMLFLNPNHPKSIKILQGALLWKHSALLETGTFTSSNGAKLLPGKEVQAISAECERSTKMVHFEDKGMFPKRHWGILEDSEGFLARMPRGF